MFSIQQNPPPKADTKKSVTFVNNFTYLQWRINHVDISHIDKIYADGILFCLLLKLLTRKSVSRYSFDGTSAATDVFNFCSIHKKSIYLLGSTEDCNLQASINIKTAFPNLIIAGRRNGYLKKSGDAELIIQHIINCKADIVIIGMGAGLQETFQKQLSQHNDWQGGSYTCGGYIHQTASKINYYPNFINKMHLRWLYRIIDEPKLIKRYLILYPKSIFFIFLDYLEFIYQQHQTNIDL